MTSFRIPGRILIATALLTATLVLPGRGAAPHFFDDDPVWVDPDTAFDASHAKEVNLSEGYDFLENTFGSPGSREAIRSLNVNTVDEVPDSSWFTNRIGRRPMSVPEIVRGPDRVDRLKVDEWIVVAGKGPAGFQPGFRAVDARNPTQVYQLEVDLREYPQLATSAEIIGTAFYHAMGYNVVDTYLVDVDPNHVRIGEGVTLRDASGTRRFTRADLDDVFRRAAHNRDGTIRMSAGRFVEGRPIGNFKHFGTRPDDPNDVYPHEHRRELRANRVFAAWLNHDDSRALNTLDMLVTEHGRTFIRHYMFDFGSILGSTPLDPGSGHEYLLEGRSTVAGLLSLGLWVPPWEFSPYPKHPPAAVGRVEGDDFDPGTWKPAYPNAAFDNMQPDDAFWGARIVARFSDEAIAAVVDKARYDDPQASAYMTATLVKRRDKLVTHWLTAVNPLVDFALTDQGVLTFANAAEDAAVTSRKTRYAVQWARFDNATGLSTRMGDETVLNERRAQAPRELVPQGISEFVEVRVRSIHPEFAAWATPVTVQFKRGPHGWTVVGLDRRSGSAPAEGLTSRMTSRNG